RPGDGEGNSPKEKGGEARGPTGGHKTPPLDGEATMTRNSTTLALRGALIGAAPRPYPAAPSRVSVKLSEWNVVLSQASVAAGSVTFVVTNAGSIPHGFEVEGQGTEQEIETIQPGASDTLTLTLKAGSYDVYCPVGSDSHKKLGMDTHLKVVSATSPAPPAPSGYGASETGESRMKAERVQAIRVTGGGPVI